MGTADDATGTQLKAYCSKIGADPLLVQGAGGNASWKDEGTLWVKASGTWLSDARQREIFVPVDMWHLRAAIGKHDFSVQPQVTDGAGLRPSIETLLHALMPHKVVVHLHPVDILAQLVRVDAEAALKTRIADAVAWIYVDYFKPGADLARAVFERLVEHPDARVLFLANHGVVIGGADTQEVASTLQVLIEALQTTPCSPRTGRGSPAAAPGFLERGYVACDDKEVSLLAVEDDLVNRLRRDWALYPDHVVFLGARPAIAEPGFEPQDLDALAAGKPPFIFALGDQVYQRQDVTAGQKCQLRCYHDVVVRQGRAERLSSLDEQQIAELLDWDAEKYRQSSSVTRRSTA